MKPKLLMAGAFLCGALHTTHAQQVRVNWGEESKKETEYREMVRGEGEDLIKLSFEHHGGGMFGGHRTVTPILTRFDKTMNVKAERTFETDDKDIAFNSLLSVKNHLFLFTSRYDNDSKVTVYYAQRVNINTLNPEGKPINLSSFDAINRSNQSSVGFELSKDSSKILMFGLAPTTKKEKENEKYYMAVYNADMQKEWEKSVELPYQTKFIDVQDRLVTNNGEVGVILKHYDQEVKKESVKEDGAKIPAYKTKILLYAKDAATPKEFLLDLQNKFVNNVQLTNDMDNNMVMFGLYRNKYDGYTTGYFITTIDKTTKAVTVKKMEAFPETLVSQIKGDKQGSDKEADPGLSTFFTLFEVMERANGSTDYILQFKRAIFHPGSSYYSGNTWHTTQPYWSYNYGDILDINVKSGGNTTFTRIPKMQSSVNTYAYSNFTSVVKGNKLILFYNDDPKNVDRDLEKKPDGVEKFSNSVYTMATIDEKGNLNRSVVYKHSDMKLVTCVNECHKISNDKIALYAMRNSFFGSSRDMIGTLEIK